MPDRNQARFTPRRDLDALIAQQRSIREDCAEQRRRARLMRAEAAAVVRRARVLLALVNQRRA